MLQNDFDCLSKLISKTEAETMSLQCCKAAFSALEMDNRGNDLLNKLGNKNIDAICIALSKGILEKTDVQSLSEMLIPYQHLSSVYSSISALGESYYSRLRPEVYSPIKEFASSIKSHSASSLNISTNIKSIIDTSWLKSNNNWLTDKKVIAGFDVSAISGLNSSFASLCRLEQITASLPLAPNNIISASAQIASISTSLRANIPFDSLFASTKSLSDYCKFASKQHRLIQKAEDQSEINWHFDLLNATSKFVDRQTKWLNSISEKIDLNALLDVNNVNDSNLTDSIICLIPQYVGYTKRKNVDKTPTEGLEESSLIKITEKGKRISDGVITINKLQLDRGSERVFELSETVVKGLIEFGSAVCTDEDQLGKIIDGLYFVFYENIEHIKLFIGKGDKSRGDALVRDESICQIIFDIKTLRSDYRHDLNHGSNSQQKKKFMDVGACYKKYCGIRPLREKDYKKLQSALYDDIIRFENWMIDIIRNQNEE